MLRLEFDSTLETGDTTVDDQHRTLIGMFNELYDASIAGTGHDVVHDTIIRLSEYTREHFAAEQRLMITSKYPPENVTVHVDEHIKLAEKTRQLVADHAEGTLTTVLPLATLLQEWLATHIRVHDRRLVEHIRAQA